MSDVTVNEPIDDKEFAFRFPEGIPVVDGTKGEPIYTIWGNGEPKIIFKSKREFGDWALAQARAAMKRNRPGWWRTHWVSVIAATLGLVAILSLRWWWRRRSA